MAGRVNLIWAGRRRHEDGTAGFHHDREGRAGVRLSQHDSAGAGWAEVGVDLAIRRESRQSGPRSIGGWQRLGGLIGCAADEQLSFALDYYAVGSVRGVGR